MDEDYKNCNVAYKGYEGLLAWKQSLGSLGTMIETLRHFWWVARKN